MKARLFWMLAAVVALGAVAQAQPAQLAHAHKSSDKERLIGAWHLVSLGEPGPGGKVIGTPGLKGMLIYTRDGHMSVQIIYPGSAAKVTNDYVLNGYEASFGTYEVDEAKHMVTHHVEGSITRGLVGKHLPRVYRLTQDGRLIIHSVNPEEHWEVTWEHD